MAKKPGRRSTRATRPASGEVRRQAAIVRRYLEALERHKPKRGRKRTPESIKKRLQAIDAGLKDAPALKRLQLTQERLDLEDELTNLQAKSDLSVVENEFVNVARAYSEHSGISYSAWRELGVTPEVLTKAGVPRTRRTSRGA